MMTSLFSGLSGLKAEQQQLDVIGNNISNVNTTAYKSQSVSFSDILSQTISQATSASATNGTGGTNAKQVGLGVSVSSTNINMESGSTESTGNNMDLSISGDGFFIVEGGSSGDHQFTRDGSFNVDSSGNLTVNGYIVCGWQEYSLGTDGNYTFNTQSQIDGINLYNDSTNGNKKVMQPSATTAATLAGTLDPSDDANGTALNAITTSNLSKASASATLTSYDAQGNSYEVQVKLYKCYTDSTTNTTSYYWEAVPTDSTAVTATNASGYIEFDSNGNIVTTDTTNYNSNPSITLTPQGSYAGAAAFNVSLNFADISYSSSASSNGISVSKIDGYASGELQDYSFDSNGVIWGDYSNGQTEPLGMIALATFNNASGLEKIGDNLYSTTANSGAFTGGVAAGSSGTGSLNVGTLELSNVNLSDQLTQMMMAQRAYQASSKVITTSDNMLETVINMLR